MKYAFLKLLKISFTWSLIAVITGVLTVALMFISNMSNGCDGGSCVVLIVLFIPVSIFFLAVGAIKGGSHLAAQVNFQDFLGAAVANYLVIYFAIDFLVGEIYPLFQRSNFLIALYAALLLISLIAFSKGKSSLKANT